MSCPRCGTWATLLRCTAQKGTCYAVQAAGHLHMLCQACNVSFPVVVTVQEVEP